MSPGIRSANENQWMCLLLCGVFRCLFLLLFFFAVDAEFVIFHLRIYSDTFTHPKSQFKMSAAFARMARVGVSKTRLGASIRSFGGSTFNKQKYPKALICKFFFLFFRRKPSSRQRVLGKVGSLAKEYCRGWAVCRRTMDEKLSCTCCSCVLMCVFVMFRFVKRYQATLSTPLLRLTFSLILFVWWCDLTCEHDGSDGTNLVG